MKKGKAVWVMVFSGILLVLSCIVFGNALIEECSRLNGSNSMQKVLVSVKNQIDPQGINSFSIDDIKRLKKKLSTKDISYTAQPELINTPDSSGSKSLTARLAGTSYTYPQFDSLALEDGSFITQKQEEEGEMVAVIDDELAWDMFKTSDVAGKTLEIYGGIFKIAGVVKRNNTLIGNLTDDGLPDVYIPAPVMLELDATAHITSLQIKTANASMLDENIEKASSAILKIGKNPSNYNIVDYNHKYALMKQKPLLFIFIIGIASMLILLVYVKNAVKKLYLLIRDRCRSDYFSNVIKRNLSGIGACVSEMVLALLGMVLIWLGIRFRLYIPPQYVPDELINISYYSDMIKSAIQSSIQNMGYVAPRSELVVNTVDALINLLFLISVVLGFLLLFAGFRELKASNMDSTRLTLTLGLLFTFSLIILAAAAFWAQLPFMPDVKKILVVWAFIFLYIITKRKESGIKNV